MARINVIPIIPNVNRIIRRRKLTNEMRDALIKSANVVRGDFKKTTRTWRDKPFFRKEGPRNDLRGTYVDVSTRHKAYFFVTRGTRKNYPIPKSPMKGKMLKFREGYRAKTRVRVISSRQGGSYGPVVYRRRVTHPGIDARDFDKEIARRRSRQHKDFIFQAIRRST